MNNRLDFLSNTLRDLDVNVIHFYYDVIKSHLDKTTIDENQRELKKLRNNYVRKIRNSEPFPISFESEAVRGGYVFHFCPSFTGAVASSFAKLLRQMPQYLDEILSKDDLTICCLGGGPGTEIVGISFIIKDILLNYSTKRRAPLIINAIVVDIDSNWKETAARIISKLQEVSPMLELRYYFLEQDLTLSTSEELLNLLNRSDIVTMVKFLTVIHGPSTADVRSRIIQYVCQSMQENAVLFYMDSAPIQSDPTHPEVHDAVNSYNMRVMYGPSKEIYRMSDASMVACQEIFQEFYGLNRCCNQSVNRVCFWRKMAT